MSFYREYFKYDGQEANKFKENFIISNLEDEMIYKFISFDSNEYLNNMKLGCIEKGTIWASHYKYFEDATELKVPLNYARVSKATSRTIPNLKFLYNTLREIYDICCFTNRIDEYMWENYANNMSGICLCFKVLDFDKYFPIEYIKKGSFDLTKSAIKSIKDNATGKGFNSLVTKEVSILPIVLKDMKYKAESEIRLMHSPFDDEQGVFGGIVRPDVKDEYKYKGTELKYESIDLKLSKVIYGEHLCSEVRDKIKEILVGWEVDEVY